MHGRTYWLTTLVFLAAPAWAGTTHSAESCGRVMVKRAQWAHRHGARHVRLPEGCPAIRVPQGYRAEKGDDGRVAIYGEGDTPIAWLVQLRDGIIGNQIWDRGKLVGQLRIEEDGK